MKKIVSWLELHWKITLLIINSIILVLVIIWYWYWSSSHLTVTLRDSELFNNIASPIVGIISGFGILITLLFLYQQNKLARGLAVRANFDVEYLSLKEKFNISEYLLTLKKEKNEFNILLEKTGSKTEIEVLFQGSEIELYDFFHVIIDELK